MDDRKKSDQKLLKAKRSNTPATKYKLECVYEMCDFEQMFFFDINHREYSVFSQEKKVHFSSSSHNDVIRV